MSKHIEPFVEYPAEPAESLPKQGNWLTDGVIKVYEFVKRNSLWMMLGVYISFALELFW